MTNDYPRPVDELVAVIASLRPDWRPVDILNVVRNDTRPWREVFASAAGATLDTTARHPARIRSWSDLRNTPTPPPIAAVLSLEDRRNALSGTQAAAKAREARNLLHRATDPQEPA